MPEVLSRTCNIFSVLLDILSQYEQSDSNNGGTRHKQYVFCSVTKGSLVMLLPPVWEEKSGGTPL